jgi:hypothetical protein
MIFSLILLQLPKVRDAFFFDMALLSNILFSTDMEVIKKDVILDFFRKIFFQKINKQMLNPIDISKGLYSFISIPSFYFMPSVKTIISYLITKRVEIGCVSRREHFLLLIVMYCLFIGPHLNVLLFVTLHLQRFCFSILFLIQIC